MGKSEQPRLPGEWLALDAESELWFDRLDDLVAFLGRVADATGEEAIRVYADHVKRQGEAAETTVAAGWAETRPPWRPR